MSGWRLFALFHGDGDDPVLTAPFAEVWREVACGDAGRDMRAILRPQPQAADAIDHDGPVMMASCPLDCKQVPGPRCRCGLYLTVTYDALRQVVIEGDTDPVTRVYAEVLAIPPVLPDPDVWYPGTARAAGVRLLRAWIHPRHGQDTAAALALRYKIPVTFFATGPRPVWEQGHP